MLNSQSEFFFKVSMTAITKFSGIIFQNQLLRETVALVTDLAIFIFDRLMDDFCGRIFFFLVLVAIVAGLGGIGKISKK